MAKCIVIYENDRYILRMITERLKARMSDMYIVDGKDVRRSREIMRFCNECIVLYDARQFGDEFRNRSDSIPIFKDGFFDYRTLVKTINFNPEPRPLSGTKGDITLLLPFVYLDDRERFIREELSEMQNTEVCLRFDLLPRIKNTSKVKGVLKDLIKECARKRFKSEQVMDYCVLDDDGFFTPGPLSDTCDISDFSSEELTNLMRRVKTLVNDRKKDVNALIVAEGLKNEKLASIAGYAGRIILLLPDEDSQDRPGMCELIAELSRASNGSDVEIRILERDAEKYEKAI